MKLRRLKTLEYDRLIAAKSGRPVDGLRRSAAEVKVGLGPSYKVRLAQCKSTESAEISVSPVHHVKRTDLDRQAIKDIDIVYLTVSNPYKQGIFPRKSMSVCSLIAPFRRWNRVHEKSFIHRSIVVESNSVDCLDSAPHNGGIRAWGGSPSVGRRHSGR